MAAFFLSRLPLWKLKILRFIRFLARADSFIGMFEFCMKIHKAFFKISCIIIESKLEKGFTKHFGYFMSKWVDFSSSNVIWFVRIHTKLLFFSVILPTVRWLSLLNVGWVSFICICMFVFGYSDRSPCTIWQTHVQFNINIHEQKKLYSYPIDYLYSERNPSISISMPIFVLWFLFWSNENSFFPISLSQSIYSQDIHQFMQF